MSLENQFPPNFKLHEFIEPGTPMPSENVIRNLCLLAHRLQVIRDLVGHPIHINSGYRTPAQNQEAGGKSKSRHLWGMAADIPLTNEEQIRLKLQTNWSGGYGKANGWCHLDIDPTKNPDGTYRRWRY